MLAKLFNNISIPSLVRALVASLAAAVLAVIWLGAENAQLKIHFFDVEISLFWFKVLMIIFTAGVAFGINSGINSIGFLKNDYQYLPVFTLLCLPMLTSGGGDIELLLTLPLGSFLVLRLLMLVSTVDPSYILFDAGVALGIVTILVPEMCFLLLVIWLAIFNFGHGGVRTFLMPIMGAAAIYFMTFTVLYWLAGINGIRFMIERFSSINLGFHFRDIEKLWVYIPLAIAAVPAFIETAQIYGKASVQKRQVFTFLLAMSGLLVLAGTYVENSFDLWIWLSIPLAALVVNLIHYRKKAWQKDLYYLLLIIFLALSILF
ncbi:DUF6427 family protein [Owenweeksia hongkongensis]|uniref:DUF6427 family protein n=1 Tax=Owenweeksia hongkongensis TaxID=253245 RepID=UPI003A916F1A